MAITLALDYYGYMVPVQHEVVVYSDSMSCLQVIESEDTENPLTCHIMNFPLALSDKGIHVRFCWVPSYCGIEGNEIADQLAKETLDHDIDPLTTVHYADLKPVNSYIQQEVQIKWDVSIHGRDLYLLKPTLGPPKKFKHLTRAEEVVITRLRIGHTKATKSHILSRGPPTACQHCGRTLTIEHMLVECTVLQQIRDEYYTAESLRAHFEIIPEACIVEFLREAGFFYLIWQAIYSIQHIIRITHQLTKFDSYINHQTLTTPLHSVIRLQSINSWENPSCERRLICLWGCVSSLNKCNPIQSVPLCWKESWIHFKMHCKRMKFGKQTLSTVIEVYSVYHTFHQWSCTLSYGVWLTKHWRVQTTRPALPCGSPGPCITNVIVTCRKNFSQWESSFLWKLRCHWLKFLRRVAKTLVILGPGALDFEIEKNYRKLILLRKVAWRCLESKTDDSLSFSV